VTAGRLGSLPSAKSGPTSISRSQAGMERPCTRGELTANITSKPDRVPLAIGSAGRPEQSGYHFGDADRYFIQAAAPKLAAWSAGHKFRDRFRQISQITGFEVSSPRPSVFADSGRFHYLKIEMERLCTTGEFARLPRQRQLGHRRPDGPGQLGGAEPWCPGVPAGQGPRPRTGSLAYPARHGCRLPQ
jgi:hypothetical protein